MNNLSCYSVPPIVLCLFDGTTTTIITEATDLPIQFPSSNVTLLDSDCSIILRHNWLTQYNPLIDWVLSSIKFRTPLQQVPAPSSLPDPDTQSLSTQRLDPSSVSSVQIIHKGALLCPVSETKIRGMLLGTKILGLQTKQTKRNSVTQKPQIT